MASSNYENAILVFCVGNHTPACPSRFYCTCMREQSTEDDAMAALLGEEEREGVLDVNAVGGYYHGTAGTALLISCSKNWLRLAVMLLDNGADVNKADDEATMTTRLTELMSTRHTIMATKLLCYLAGTTRIWSWPDCCFPAVQKTTIPHNLPKRSSRWQQAKFTPIFDVSQGNFCNAVGGSSVEASGGEGRVASFAFVLWM